MSQRRKVACKTPIFASKKASVLKTPFKLDRVTFSTPESLWRKGAPKVRREFFWQAPKHTRKRNTTWVLDRSQICDLGCAVFSGVWRPLRALGEQRAPKNATPPKTQSLGTVTYLRFRVCCVFGCSLFFSDSWEDNIEGFEASRIHLKLKTELANAHSIHDCSVTRKYMCYSVLTLS